MGDQSNPLLEFLDDPENVALMMQLPPADVDESFSEDEVQLHEDEGTPKNNRKRHNYDAATKLEAVKWARENALHGKKFNVKSASKKFDVDRKCIKQWITQEGELKRQV